MKKNVPITKNSQIKSSIIELKNETSEWISEIKFIYIEQDFLEELLAEHVMGLCKTNNYSQAKLFLKGITHERKLGKLLEDEIRNHNVNLALLIENIYLKKEDSFRDKHKVLLSEVKNYIQNFKYIKEKVFELVLQIMKSEKKKKLLL